MLERGWRAVVTAWRPEHLSELVAPHGERALVLRVDVTDKGSIAHAVRQAMVRFGHVDVLVNNAGYGYLAAIEEGDDRQIRDLFETDVFGLIRDDKGRTAGDWNSSRR